MEEEKQDLQKQLNPQVLFSWRAPLRPYIKRSAKIVRFYIAIALLLSLIVFFFGDRILLIPIWALLFIFYVFTVTPPPTVENKITQFGIESNGVTLRWNMLSHFYFTDRFGYEVLTTVTHEPYYHSYFVVPNDEIKRKITLLLADHIVYQEKPKKALVEKLVDWFSRLIPEEEERVQNHTPI